MLADIDGLDRAAGIVRVDTTDEALVERLATVLWQTMFPAYQNDYRRRARAVLAALREAAQ